jgi:hypothetical protein
MVAHISQSTDRPLSHQGEALTIGACSRNGIVGPSSRLSAFDSVLFCGKGLEVTRCGMISRTGTSAELNIFLLVYENSLQYYYE